MMKLTSELVSLLIISTATGLMWIPYILARMARLGLLAAIGNPNRNEPEPPPWADRAKRAHVNAVENLTVFAPVVLVAALAGVSTPVTVLAAQTYVVARLVHYLIYVSGLPVLRTLAFLIGAMATLVISIVVLFHTH